MAKKKNPILREVTIEKMAAEGKCVAHHDGKVVFVKNVAPGDVADLRITRKKKKFFEARPVHFHQLSKDRVVPFCSHFGICGGCKWQHIPYEQQLGYKQQQVLDHFERIAKVEIHTVRPIIPADKTTYYRNKLEFTFSSHRWLTPEEIQTGETLDRRVLGFHIPESFEKVLQIEHCYLQPDPSNEIRLSLEAYALQKDIAFYDHTTHQGVLRNLIIRDSNTGQSMVVVQFGGDAEAKPQVIEQIMSFLRDKFSQITSLHYIINPKKNDTYHDLKAYHFSGEYFITEQMEDLTFRISPKAFFQTNSRQAYRLYQVARELADIQEDELVYDLYTGTGTIANFVARQAKKVVGIEYVEEAISDAQVNAQINQIDNAAFFAGDIRETLNDEFVGQHGKPDVIITDPPRSGMHPDIIAKILELRPSRIIYISCNPATQARDVSLLDERYNTQLIQAVDMFPHTHHIENIAYLKLR